MSSVKGESLFRVARGERPSKALREQTLAAMRAAARDAKPTRAWRSSTTAPVAALVVTALAVAAGFVIVPKQGTEPSPGGTIAAERFRADGRKVRAEAPAVTRLPTSAQAPAKAPAPLPRPQRPRPTLAEETAALDQVRAAIQGGDGTRALALLDGYDRRGEGENRMSAEATVLRIEALVSRGSTAKARQLATTFIEKNADNPLTDRARAILAKLDGSTDTGVTP
jgi:hypothetical protein